MNCLVSLNILWRKWLFINMGVKDREKCRGQHCGAFRQNFEAFIEALNFRMLQLSCTVLPFTHFYQPHMSKYFIYINHDQNQNLFQKVKCYDSKNFSFYNANFYVWTRRKTVMTRLLTPLFFS